MIILGLGNTIHVFSHQGQALTTRCTLHRTNAHLKGCHHGVVFVADSQEARMDANVEAISNLRLNLKDQGYDLENMPYALQLNKRDLPNVTPVDQMVQQLRRKGEPVFEAVASKGTGVFETLKGVAKLVLQELTKTG